MEAGLGEVEAGLGNVEAGLGEVEAEQGRDVPTTVIISVVGTPTTYFRRDEGF